MAPLPTSVTLLLSDPPLTDFSPQQAQAITEVGDWLAAGPSSDQVYYLAGYAGTGKTTIAKHLAGLQDGQVCFAAYTGKAASVLRRKGCDATTIHSLIYKVSIRDKGFIESLRKKLKDASNPELQTKLAEEIVEANTPRFILNEDDSIVNNCDLIIIDECSMVGEQIGNDLLSFGKKVLVLGDPGQLPPVEGGGFFTNRTPNIVLTEIHRQARGNPIINMATMVRQGNYLKPGSYGSSSVFGRQHVPKYSEYDQVIVGLNRTRKKINSLMRDELGIDGPFPVAGDKLICLKNNRDLGLLNGTQWKILSVEDGVPYYSLELEDWDQERKEPLKVKAHPFDADYKNMMWWDRKRANEFDYGYAITCHKSQGSQWGNILIHNEAFAFRENASKWLYTALTRAENQVTVIL